MKASGNILFFVESFDIKMKPLCLLKVYSDFLVFLDSASEICVFVRIGPFNVSYLILA